MKKTKILVIAGLLALTTIVSTAFINKHTNARKPAPGKGFAVVELFTSEGCSSCPPADEAVARLQKETGDKPIYILAFHVDYWNSLGWKDVFSSAQYSKRQREYARYLNLSSVYTPQIVVNGSKEFVGSEETTLRSAVKSALLKDAAAQVVLSVVKADQNQAKVHYQVDANGDNNALLIALVEKTATSHVKAGENGGRTLSHVQIVQNLQAVNLNGSKTGTENVAVPAGFNAQNWELVAFVQNTSTGEISGAIKAQFASANNEPTKNTK